MAVKSNFLTMTVVLTVVCLVCSGILGGVYALTADPIAQTNRAILERSVREVLPEGGILSDAKALQVGGRESEYYLSAREDGTPLAYAVKSVVNGFGGALEMMVGITADGQVYNTSVLSHSETPGLGAKCTEDEAFYGQFSSGSAYSKHVAASTPEKDLQVKKDGGSLDAITASTITSRAYILAVRQALEAYRTLQGEAAQNEGGQSNE